MDDQIYQTCAVTFVGCKTWVDLIDLDMVDFCVIFCMDWLAPYYVGPDCYAKTMTLDCGCPKKSIEVHSLLSHKFSFRLIIW